MELENWIAAHINLLTVLGIPLLTFLVTFLSNRGAEKRANQERRVERKLAQELKLVDFRQAWINDLRNAFSEYHHTLFAMEGGDYEAGKIAEVVSKILMMMNPKDADYSSLIEIHEKMLREKNESAEYPDITASIEIAQRILKREWDRLKQDLSRVEVSQ